MNCARFSQEYDYLTVACVGPARSMCICELAIIDITKYL